MLEYRNMAVAHLLAQIICELSASEEEHADNSSDHRTDGGYHRRHADHALPLQIRHHTSPTCSDTRCNVPRMAARASAASRSAHGSWRNPEMSPGALSNAPPQSAIALPSKPRRDRAVRAPAHDQLHPRRTFLVSSSSSRAHARFARACVINMSRSCLV